MEWPAEFEARMMRLCGDAWRPEQEAPARGLRINPLKAEPSAVIAAHGLTQPVPFSPFGYAVAPEFRAGADPLHHAGAYYMQEPSAMSAVTALNPQPGEWVLDLCAAPGGKSTQIAAALQGQGLLWCNEYVTARTRMLMQNLERCGVTNAVVTNQDAASLCEAMSGHFDAVLVDAPCSGEGMFRKEPDALTMWSVPRVQACAQRAAEILDAAALAVRHGGRLLLSTCTFAPEENECQVAHFLARHPDFSLEKMEVPFGRPGFSREAVAPFSETPLLPVDLTLTRRILPPDGGEGHFLALLRREGEEPRPVDPAWEDERGAAEVRAALAEWTQVPPGVLRRFGERWRMLPSQLPRGNKIPLLMAGVPCAEVRPGRWEPTHAWFSAWGKTAHRRCDWPCDSEEIRRFLRGEVLPCAEKGYTAVLTEGVPVGFGKAGGGVLKNHYPKGLRLLG